MTTTRRTFLKVLGSSLVGAAVVPALPAPVAADPIYDLRAAARRKGYRGGRGLAAVIEQSMETRSRYRAQGLVFDADVPILEAA